MWDRVDGAWKLRLDAGGVAVLQKSQPPEILFIERRVQLLKPGSGRMAILVPNGILNNPALGYVRRWLLTHTQVLAVVDMARELLQPKNDTQTSMLLLRRLSDAEVASVGRRGLDYPIFMAVTEKIGHDKRGNVFYRRDDKGDDILVEQDVPVRDIDEHTGEEVLTRVLVRERVIDDDLPEIALAYRQWLTEQA